jgi:hypothetical protein
LSDRRRGRGLIIWLGEGSLRGGELVKFLEALNLVRRRLGLLLPVMSDVVWLCQKFVADNREVFEELK